MTTATAPDARRASPEQLSVLDPLGALQQLQAAEFRKAQIGHHGFEGFAAQDLEGLRGIADDDHLPG